MGATTVGQTFDPAVANTCFGTEWDVLQAGRASGPSYAVPSDGVLTSWSFQASSTSGQTTHMRMRVFRPTGTPHQYTVVADGSSVLQTIPPASGLHTFPTGISVRAGDFVGINSTDGTCATNTGNAGDAYDFHSGGTIPSGTPTNFTASTGWIWDISARLEADCDKDGLGDETQDPDLTACHSNAFTFAGVTGNKKKGTATLKVNVPEPGELVGSGNGAKVAAAGATTSKAVTAGTAQLLIKAKGKKKRKLNETGKVKLSVAVTYTPTGGKPNTQTVKVKLKKKL
jgi:hypothetical protein